MKKTQKFILFILSALLTAVFVALSTPSMAFASQETKTFGDPDVAEYNSSVGQLVGYCADSATATQYCKEQGYDGYTSYNPRYIGPTLYNDRLYIWEGSKFKVVDGYNCPKVLSPITCYKNTCSSQDIKKCSGNDIYWYDSCGSKKNLYKECASDEVCQNAQCVKIECDCNVDCGNSGFIGDAFCKNSDVYKNYKTFTCQNPGTSSSKCVDSTAPVLWYACDNGQTCSGGTCIDVVCNSNSDCGSNGYVDGLFCQGNNVYQNYTSYTCNNAGTAQSYCSNNTESQLKQTCGSNQTCNSGICQQNPSDLVASCYSTPNPVNVGQQISFVSNATGGNGSYTYSWTGACMGSSQVCSTLFNDSGNRQATITVTSDGHQTSAVCEAGINQNCSHHAYQRCVGNNLQWYDSCGNQEDYQYCENGCSNNQCGGGGTDSYTTVQTNPATNIYNSQATLNGHLYRNENNSCTTYVWFQYGPTSSYGYETTHKVQNYSGSFSETVNLYNIYNNNYDFSNYHFRAIARDCSGNSIYGQDLSFGSGTNNGIISISKTVKNLTSGSGFSNSVYASPSDMLMFMVTLQTAGNQTASNIRITDLGSNGLIYRDQLTVSGANYTGDMSSGIYINNISPYQTVTITYQAQVANSSYFSYGTTTLTNNASITGSGYNYNQTASATVTVNRTAVYGATSISTGLTNNLLVDSFLLPLLFALLGIWLWKSGLLFGIEKWLGDKKKQGSNYKSEKELNKRIEAIQNMEGV